MIIEHRLRWFDHIYTNTYEWADIISFGSESCPRALPDTESYDYLIELLCRKHILPKLVTPRVSQSELPDVIHLLDYIVDRNIPLDIVVNDWGILFYCLKRKDVFQVHIGRQLCRSLFDSPWAKYILHNENQDVVKFLKAHPYDDYTKLELIREWGIKGVEINSFQEISHSIQSLISFGLEVAIDVESSLLTAGKKCLARRICSAGDCSQICSQVYSIEPKKKWQGFFDNKENYKAIEKEALDGMMISGNRVLLKHKTKISSDIDLDNIVVIITDPKTSDNFL